ncbi:helix-turn-helix transcriptional regulator [Streptomyces chromofuscus]|uniref:Helix-turn-helix transcriptional regulator n=1 Tax=Streptomyces chromofuscus TaxID=42881 RepID=A0A7M2T516_STRCW|nr:helix-turn-helix transcriptional regulator [Streptomyces chromofuscus]QOV43692.1 helix-turn-helix transcriptional regulator [Streptomyces chromofuscus]GGT34918.1 LuxR family transcriptional regulator [Streptomyces chromofuscus]
MNESKDPSVPPYFGEDDILVYGWILDGGGSRADRAASELGLTPERAAAALERLWSLNLIRTVSPRPGEITAVDPDAVADALTAPLRDSIRRQEEQLERIRSGIGLLRDRFLNRRPGGDDSAVDVIPTLEEVRAALNRASAECREEVVSSQPGGNGRIPEAMEEALGRDHALLSRNVRMRTLYHHTARFNGPSQAYVAAATALGAEYRTSHELFGRLIIYDRSLAFLPDRNGSWGAVAVREPTVVQYLYDIFEQYWTRATPFSDAAQHGLEQVAKEIHSTIVLLLAAGLKDEAIARRLGMSLRTARRHIADIMGDLGAESRFQAGVLVAQSGLVNRSQPGV